MPKLKIFLSYSFHNEVYRLALASVLVRQFEVRWDTGQPHTADLYREISSNLNWSDVVIPIITQEWLQSHECRDELVRANERRKLIIPFRHKDVNDDGPPKVPWYLRNALSVLWTENELSRAMTDLVERLENTARDAWQPGCYRDLRVIGDDIQAAQLTPCWKAALCSKVLSLTKSQIHNILAGDSCTFPVSHEHAYLRFAEPVFAAASSIVAICIASISTFWTNPDFKSDTGAYLKYQLSAESICRLFVFTSSEEVLAFRSILQKHHDAYGFKTTQNGVFICSASAYKGLLERWSRETDEAALRQDFGLLSFEEGPRMHATLDRREFAYTTYDADDYAYIGNRITIEHFESFRRLGLGEIDADSGVARWAPKFAQSDAELAAQLDALFEDRSHRAVHVVLLKACQDSLALGEYLRQLVLRFTKSRNVLRIASVAVKRRCDLTVADARYAAPLLGWSEFDYAMFMEFESEDALTYYYQHQIHSFEREKLYTLLNPQVAAQFELAASLDSRQQQERAAIFSQIEKQMVDGGFISRIDLLDDDSLGHLIARHVTTSADAKAR